MATDTLILGGIVFDDWSTPADIPFGGKQSLVVHKFAGGQRVVDILGPDEMDIKFTGILWGAPSVAVAMALNGMRQAGNPVALSFGGQSYSVIVQDCVVRLKRFPLYSIYDIECLTVSAAMAGALSGIVSTLTGLVGADIATVMSLAGL